MVVITASQTNKTYPTDAGTQQNASFWPFPLSLPAAFYNYLFVFQQHPESYSWP